MLSQEDLDTETAADFETIPNIFPVKKTRTEPETAMIEAESFSTDGGLNENKREVLLLTLLTETVT
jgi:hypothetical protein